MRNKRQSEFASLLLLLAPRLMSSSQLKDVLATAYTASPSIFITSVLVLAASLYAMGLFSRSNHFLPAGKVSYTSYCHERTLRVFTQHCYIGGGSEGLGFALACQLVARGAHVTIVSRSEAKLALALTSLEVCPDLLSISHGL